MVRKCGTALESRNLFALGDNGEDFVDLVVAQLSELVVACRHGDLNFRRLEIGRDHVLQSCDC